jgi:hypothetical protein
MDGEGLYCPMEECEENRGGYCNVKQDGPLGWASAAFFMPGQAGLSAPFGQAMGMMPGGAAMGGRPPGAPEWGLWRNCPRLREKNLRK